MKQFSRVGLILVLGPALVLGGETVLGQPSAAAASPHNQISYVGSATATAVGANAVVVPALAGGSAADLLIARVASRGSGVIHPGATGWSRAGSTSRNGLTSTVMIKVLGPTEPSSYDFSASSPSDLAVSISLYRGVDPVEPVDTYVGLASNDVEMLATPTITTSSGNDVLAWFGTQVESEEPCPELGPGTGLEQPSGFIKAANGCLGSTGGSLTFTAAYRQIGAAATQAGVQVSSRRATTSIAEAVALRPAGVRISHRGTTSMGAVNGSALSLTTPVGTVVGDVVLAHIANRNHVDASLIVPDGWTFVRKERSSYQVASWVYLRVATVNEPETWTFLAEDEQTLVGSLSSYIGVDTAKPIDVSAGRINGTSSRLTGPSLTTQVNHDQAVWFSAQAQNTGECPSLVLSVPLNFESRTSQCVTGLGRGLRVAVADAPLAAAGLESGFDGSSDQSVTNATIVVALRAAPATSVSDNYASTSLDVGKLWLNAGGKRDTSLPHSILDQPSGVATSRVNPGVIYVHSEKDVHGMVAVSTEDAEVVADYSVPIPQQWDWEDIATGPCPTGSCIFAGDIGRANGRPNQPSTFAIYRVPEPEIASGQDSGVLEGDWFRFRYPDAPHNAEAMMVHPVTGAIYVITKVQNGESGVYTFPNPLPAPSADTVTTLTKIGTLHVPRWAGDPANSHASTWFAQVTAASIHPTGDRFVIRTPYEVYEYRAAPSAPFESAFTGDPTTLTAPTGEGQGEAIDYALDGSAYYTVSESTEPPYVLKRVNRS